MRLTVSLFAVSVANKRIGPIQLNDNSPAAIREAVFLNNVPIFIPSSHYSSFVRNCNRIHKVDQITYVNKQKGNTYI